MRITRWRVVSTALFSALALLAQTADAKTVRVFAVGPKFDLTWVDTREHYRAKLLALADASQRGRLPATIQPGAADVASHLLPGPDNELVALPEDVGLMAAFAGSRGNVARQAPDLIGAIGSLIVAYAPVNAYYEARFPSLAQRPLPTRLLAVSLTDTFGRVAVETFAELADTHDVWLEAGVNMAREWQIVCVDKDAFRPPPTGEQCAEENAAKVAHLRDPDEPGRDYAYESTTDQPSNMALVFGPDGRLVSKQVKTYITPVELPASLDLVPGHVTRGLSVLETPVGRLGFVTSKDAWMPDVTSRLDQQRAEILVQPEFFVNDTVSPGEGMWAPDNLKASGYSDVLRHPSLKALVLPEMTGNVFDFSADAQQHIVLKPGEGRSPRGGLVGQPAAPGFARVQEWVVPDPLRRGEPMPARRERLGKAGQAMLPTSSTACTGPEAGPCRGGQVEGVIFADVEVDGGTPPAHRPRARRKRTRTPFSVNRPIAPSPHPQRNVTLASRGRTVWAAFEQRDRILVARSRDGGRTWSGAVRAVAREATQWWPSLSVGRDGRLWLAWSDDSSGELRAYYATARGDLAFGAPQPLDPGPARGVAQLKPSIAAGGEGRAVAAWIDERDPVPGETGLQEAGVFLARVGPDGPLEAGRRLDGGEPHAYAQTLDHAWAPSVAASGRRVAVAWIDFRTYDWRVWMRTSADGGESFSEERYAGAAPAQDESLSDAPQAAFWNGPLAAFTDYRKRESSRRPHQLYDIAVARPGGRLLRADHHGARQLSSFNPAFLALSRRRALVAFQDHARGPGDILLATLGPAGRRGPVRRVDDAGPGGPNQWRPELVRAGRGRVLAAWEDERDGPAQVFAATASTKGLR